MAAVQKHRIAKDLSDLALSAFSQEISDFVALEQRVLADLDLDELVRVQCLVHGGYHALGDTLFAQVNHRGQAVP